MNTQSITKNYKKWKSRIFVSLCLILMSSTHVYGLDLADFENTATVSTTGSFDDDDTNNEDTIQVTPQIPLTVTKVLSPTTDDGQFIMDANGTTVAEGGNGATVTENVIVGTIATFAETAGTGTDLSNYISSYECLDQDGGVITSGTGNSGSFTMPTAPLV